MSEYSLQVLEVVIGFIGAVADIAIVVMMWREGNRPKPERRYWPWVIAIVAVTIVAAGPATYRLISSSEARASGASIFLQFSDQHTVPKEIRQTNIRSWYALYTESIYIQPLDQDNKPMPGGTSVPPRWSIFVLFETPANYRQMIATCTGGKSLNCAVQMSNDRYAIITAIGDVTGATLDVSTQ